MINRVLIIASRFIIGKKNKAILNTIVKSRRKYHQLAIGGPFNRKKVKYLVAAFTPYDFYGITDRFRAISGVCETAIHHSLEFRIQQESPYSLRDYLIPNEIDWAAPWPKDGGSHIFLADGDWETQRNTLDFFVRHCQDSVLYIHGNSSFGIPYFKKNMRTLFKTSAPLESLIHETLKKLGNFNSVTFRFVNLLGDSNEDVEGYITLPECEQKSLINTCITTLLHIKSTTALNFLVTTDSSKFLRHLDFLNETGIYHLEGDDVHQHVGYSEIVSQKAMLKSFAEFFLIGRANIAFQIKVGPMYVSSFPERAASIGGVPYELLEIPIS